MLPSVRKKITAHILEEMKKRGVTWTTIQKIDIREEWGLPCRWRTLYNIIKKECHPTKRVETGILEYFKESYNVNNNIVTLVDTSEYESQ